ncbi:oxidoreductase [Streptomyces sp. I05A-00742]|uniref:oxidoreductase n=1 Tax=Streptomyces sp. I05A-00742 TaxID=2732853 RepID=UPI002016ED91|nr:oxidoreductase [Streptomyces sp. I05A-00742]
MTVEYATLGLAHTTRAGGVLGGRACQVRREFVDFTVDGRPLLLHLADLDGFPPPASDLVPVPLAPGAHRRPLPGTGDPPEGGRSVLYTCPDCPGPECGEVTAVVEPDGQGAVVWRDFAWRDATGSGGAPDGTGPFRFRAEEYRRVAERLLADGTPAAPPPLRVLLVGPRVASFARLAAALRAAGIGADLTRDATGAAPEELREYGAVLFDRAVGEPERAAARAAFTAAGASATLVDRPAPLLPVLVAQLEQLVQRPADAGTARHRLVGLHVDGAGVRVEVASACRVRLTGYRQDRLRRIRTAELFAGRLERGAHLLDGFGGAGAFVVARTFGGVAVAGGPGPGPGQRKSVGDPHMAR